MDTNSAQQTPTICMENGIPLHAWVIGLPYFVTPLKGTKEAEQPKPTTR